VPSVLLVRHGQASFGAADYDVLSPVGVQQAEVVADRLATLPNVRRIVTGAMVRQRGTAAPLADRLPDVRRSEDARFDEYDHVELVERASSDDGTDDDPRRAFQGVLERALDRWTGGAHDDYRESYTGFRDRVRTAVAELVADLGRAETAVVVTSGGVISAICADALHLDAAGWARLNTVIVNSSVTKLVAGRRGTTLVTINDHAHLEGEAAELLTYR
jgi:broad specificity phosphatase PhoE